MSHESSEVLSFLPHEIIGEIIVRSNSDTRVLWSYVSKQCYSYVVTTIKHIASYDTFLQVCSGGDVPSIMRGPALYSHVVLGLTGAIRNGHIDLVKFLKKKLPYGITSSPQMVLEVAQAKGYNDIVEEFMHIDLNDQQLIYEACVHGNVEIVKCCLQLGINRDGLLNTAYRHKHDDIVSLLLENHEFSDREMFMFECIRGNKDNVLAMIERGIPLDSMSLSAACTSGNMDLVKHLLSIDSRINNLDMSMCAMCNEGNSQMAQLLMEHGAHITNDLCSLVVASGNVDFVRLVLKDRSINLNNLFHYACAFGNIEMIKIISAHGSVDWNAALSQGCLHGHQHIVEYALKNTKWNWDWNLGLMNACRKGDGALMNLMLEEGADDYNNGLRGGCMSGNINCIKKMLSLGADNFDIALSEACEYGQIDAAKLMLTCGAKIVDRIKRRKYPEKYPELMKLVQLQ